MSPLAIMDLQVIGVSKAIGKIQLRWTSVGDNYDSTENRVEEYKVGEEKVFPRKYRF
jgi:hypothetical protein